MDFKTIVNILFKDKYLWKDVSDDDKEYLFFIVNRYLSKKHPARAQKFNKRNIDKASALDIWFLSLKNEKQIPFWFWKGPTKRKDPEIKNWKLLQEFYKEISINDIYYICDMFPEEAKEEIKRIEKINEEIEK